MKLKEKLAREAAHRYFDKIENFTSEFKREINAIDAEGLFLEGFNAASQIAYDLIEAEKNVTTTILDVIKAIKS